MFAKSTLDDEDTLEEKCAGSSSESVEEKNLRKETLVKLENELRSYVPNDSLDEDEIITIIAQMNAEDKQRQITKEQLMQLDRLAPLRDNQRLAVSVPINSKLYEKLESTVDGDFFDSIVDSAIDKCRKDTGPVLDDRELDLLRESLGIMTYGPGKRNRRKKAFSSLAEDLLAEGNGDAKEFSTRGGGNRRVTRNSTVKRIQEHQRLIGLDKVNALIEIMTETKQVDQLSQTYTDAVKRAQRDVRSKLEYWKLQKNKKNRIEHPNGKKRKLTQESTDSNSPRKKLKIYQSGFIYPKTLFYRTYDEDWMESTATLPIQNVNTTDINTHNVPTPRYLDWQRRQRPTEKRSTVDSIQVSSSVKPLYSQSIVPLPSLQGFDATIRSDPPRYRHSDHAYGLWSSRLIKYLNGSGRLFARNEFFYSDIDRAWYNQNPFLDDLVKLGFPPDIELSRMEWSYVRRQMKNKPRRFSKRFILSQLILLETYRNNVRSIQRSPNDPSVIPPGFGYEVLFPISVGSTVTAYNKRTKLLHRGVVLSKGSNRLNTYVVQFERKELGFELCMDIDIATHGVKEILLPAKTRAAKGSYVCSDLHTCRAKTDELAYGSTYGTLLNFNAALTSTGLRNFYNRISSVHVVTEQDKATEKELLVKLMFMMSSSLKRKARILKTIEKFNKVISICEKRSNESASSLLNRPGNKQFHAYYVWLKQSLMSTNIVINKCLRYQQIMYSQAYTFGVQSNLQLSRSSPFSIGTKAAESRFGMALKNSIHSGSRLCGEMVSNFIQKNTMHQNGHSSSLVSKLATDNDNFWTRNDSYVKDCVSAASSLLFATDLCLHSICENGEDQILNAAVIQSIMTDAQTWFRHNDSNRNVPVNFSHILQERDLGFKALTEAFSMLGGELGLLA